MEVTIFDRLSGNVPEIKKELQKENKLFREALERQYNFDKLTFIKLTRAEAIKVNLGDVKTINEVYFRNIKHFKNIAGYYHYNKSFGAKIYYIEDILQQIYVDLRYYDFTKDSTARKCLNITCLSSNYGGILHYLEYRSDRKATRFLYDQINAHNSKMEEAAELIDFIGADERRSNPETILIDREEPKLYTQVMHVEIIKSLPRSQRYKYIEAFEGGK